MSTDYDAPRTRPEEESGDESLEALRASRASRRADTAIEDEANVGEDAELPGADLSGEELVVQILPVQRDEFSCTRCFLVMHRSQRVRTAPDVCADCA